MFDGDLASFKKKENETSIGKQTYRGETTFSGVLQSFWNAPYNPLYDPHFYIPPLTFSFLWNVRTDPIIPFDSLDDVCDSSSALGKRGFSPETEELKDGCWG